MIHIKREEFPFVLLCCLLLVFPPLSAIIGYALLYPLLIHHFGPQTIPLLYLGIAIVSFFTTTLYLLFVNVIRVERLIIICSLLSIIGLILGRFFILPHFDNQADFAFWRWGLYLFFVLFAYICCNTLIPIQIWSCINASILPSQARRFYKIFFLAILAGRIIGSTLVSLVVVQIGVENLSLIWIISLAAIIPSIFNFKRFCKSRIVKLPFSFITIENNIELVQANLKNFAGFIKKSDIAKVLITVPFFLFVINLLVESQYAKIISTKFSSSESLSQFYGYYFGFRNITAVIGYLLLSSWFIHKLGILRSMMTVPIVALCGFLLITFRFEFIEALIFYYFFDMSCSTIHAVASQLAVNVVPTKYRDTMRGIVYGIMFSLGTFMGVVIYILCQSPIFGSYSTVYVTNGAAIIIIVLWLILLMKGKIFYIENLTVNLKNHDNNTVMDAIESLEERKEPKAYEALLSVLLDENKRYNKEMIGSAMKILVKLGWLKGIRAIYLYLDNSDPRLRLYAISSILHFKHLSNNPFAIHTINKKIKHLFLYDPSKSVRIEAAKFLIQQLPKNELLELSDSIYDDADPIKRMLMIQSLRTIDYELVDLILLEGLKDPDPSICKEVLVGISRFPEYINIFNHAVIKLMTSEQESHRIEGLKTLILTSPKFSYISEIAGLLNDSSPGVRCFAGVAYLSDPNKDTTIAHIALEKTLETLSNPALSSANKEEFAVILPALQQDVMDLLIDAIYTLPKEKREIANHIIRKFGIMLEEKFEEESFELDIATFISGLKLGY